MKNTKNIKQNLLQTRMTQASQRYSDAEVLTEKSEDLESFNVAGLYGKAMSHDNTTGLPIALNVKDLVFALESGDQKDFDNLNQSGTRKHANPQASLSIELMGGDPEGLSMPKSPKVDSREAAAEMIEVYEKNILRDIPFNEINGNQANSDLDRAIASLNSFGEDFTGPKENGLVTRKTLFRGNAPGELVGPYVSQFMLLDVQLGNHTIVQKGPTKTGVYGITESDWLSIQEGNIPTPQTIDSNIKYIYNPRQLGSFVHIDFVYQAFLYAAAIMASNGMSTQDAFPSQAKEGAFVTNGGIAEISSVVGDISRHALKASWVQKWRRNLKLRPEAMAGRVVKEQDGALSAGTVHADLFTLGANTLNAVKAFNLAQGGDQKAWLPIQYAEGSPTHPSYPAGHAVIAGACATVLKIYFKEQDWSNTGLSVFESVDGSTLSQYAEGDEGMMTLHGELNKLASNMSIGRNMAGVHYRSDGDQGMILGEKVAIEYFKDVKSTYNEDVGTISFVGFDGTLKEI